VPSWIYLLYPPLSDEAAARAIMESDPAGARGVVTGELREMRVSLLRGRD